ncbi:hypothetical protein BpHYR1_032467 [Brachionus plicatilis]|uniref:Uncharacterized protein n=1 Tax=Brachionus plicatilis TaxID=10195 RepID=A0A3M7TA57_BRAPC|nr:hypothetical protein BpHYR1_032467 [Brachionus plicatilis]
MLIVNIKKNEALLFSFYISIDALKKQKKINFLKFKYKLNTNSSFFDDLKLKQILFVVIK